MASLNDSLLAHQINTIKHGSELGQSVIPYLNEMKAVIRKKVAGFDAEKRTAKRLETMLKTLANTLNKPAGKWLAELEKALKEFAKYEIAYQAETIGGWVGVNMTEPTIGQAWAAAQFQPLALSTSPIDFNKMMDDWGVDEVNRLVMGVKAGFVEGLTTRQIIKNVVGDGGLADISLRNAKAVAHTALMHVATEARFATYQENEDVVIGYEWASTLDGRTSDVCRARDGQVYLFTDKVQPKPPAHYNCLSGDTVVATCSAVSNVYKRPYKGAIVNVRTKSGRSMTITPNHPVLTSAGWVAACDLNLGSELVCCNDIGMIIKNQKDCVVSEFSDLFGSAYVFGDSHLVGDAPSTTKNFHGDISNGEINIVSVDGKAWEKIKSSVRKNGRNNGLPLGSIADLPLLANSAKVNPLIGELNSPDGSVGFSSKSSDLLRSASGHSCELLLASSSECAVFTSEQPDNGGVTARKTEVGCDTVSANSAIVCSEYRSSLGVGKGDGLCEAKFNSSRGKDSLDWLFSAAESLPNLFGSQLVDGVELDDVVDLFIGEYDGHVYNLENENNWYISNGIITHNCRSSTAPKLSPEFDIFDEGATRASKGADGGKQVSADLSYYQWLKQQPSAYQDEVLGKTKGGIFRNAGLDAQEFRKITVDDLGRPLTLKEMAEADKRVASYLAKS